MVMTIRGAVAYKRLDHGEHGTEVEMQSVIDPGIEVGEGVRELEERVESERRVSEGAMDEEIAAIEDDILDKIDTKQRSDSNSKEPTAELSSVPKTMGNIFISFVGAGILGLPYTFRRSGVLIGTTVLGCVASLSLHCMFLLMDVKRKLEADHGATSYSAVAYYSYGRNCQLFVEGLLVVTQVGFCIGYLVFIGKNMSSLDLLPSELHIAACIPVLIALAMLRSLTALAPFSILADVGNLMGITVVLYHDFVNVWEDRMEGDRIEHYNPNWAWEGISSIPFIFGVYMYCYEGFGMIIPIEAAMKDRPKFNRTLTSSMIVITSLFLVFGLMGYSAFGSLTEDIVTLNLPNDFTAKIVKICLCIGLLFTFPVMLVPVYEIVETNLQANEQLKKAVPSPRLQRTLFDVLRGSLVTFTGIIAACVPGFGVFISLVGSLCCAFLAFVLPAAFHLKVFHHEISRGTFAADVAIIVFGCTFALLGTVDALETVYRESMEMDAALHESNIASKEKTFEALVNVVANATSRLSNATFAPPSPP